MGIYNTLPLLFSDVLPSIDSISTVILNQRKYPNKLRWITLVWITLVWTWVWGPTLLLHLPNRRWIWAWAGLRLVRVSAIFLVHLHAPLSELIPCSTWRMGMILSKTSIPLLFCRLHNQSLLHLHPPIFTRTMRPLSLSFRFALFTHFRIPPYKLNAAHPLSTFPTPSLTPHLFTTSLPALALLAFRPLPTCRQLTPSLDALELVHRRHMLPILHLAQQYQSQIRRISHRRFPPRHRHRRFKEVGKGLRSTNCEYRHGDSC